MEENQWQDPLLITDVPSQMLNHNHKLSTSFLHSHMTPRSSSFATPNASSGNVEADHDFSRVILDRDVGDFCRVSDKSILGFSLSSPDLVVCTGSPEFHPQNNIREGMRVGNGAEENQIRWKSFDNQITEASFELLQTPKTEKHSAYSLSEVNINVGAENSAVYSGLEFSVDKCFNGGDTIFTNAVIVDGDPLSMYQTARSGNFSYNFNMLGPGYYLVSLHFAEIVFVDGPPGIRKFDVYLQENKVGCGIDIYALVGGNRPFVISDLKASIDGYEGLSLRFEGVVRGAIVCGISIREDLHKNIENNKSLEFKAIYDIFGQDQQNVISDGSSDEIGNQKEDQKIERDELEKIKQVLDNLRSENELKKRECEVANDSLKELQNELMRKSMCVGSLAFAVEGQVKEKSKWFSSLRYLSRKVKILKMGHTQIAKEASEFKEMVTDIKNEISSSITSKLNEHMYQYEDLKLKFMECAKDRKQLYNKVAELKGNIRVFCRSRPLNLEEAAAGSVMAVDFGSANDGEIYVKQNGILKKSFKFDAAFAPNAHQVDVFEEAAPLAASVLDGFNVCIFAYGQTGTGKTFTMEGTEEDRGVNFRTLERLFLMIKEREDQFKYSVSVSVMEVYNEQIRDLLSTQGAQSGPGVVVASKRLEIRQTSEGNSHHVPGIIEANVSNMKEVWQVLQTGSNARVVGSTGANDHSSRSHCIHCVMVKGYNLVNGEYTRSKLWLVDLAGSERIAKTEVQGERLKEAQNINKSLSALGDVISSLAAKSSHIPFRNSKLTHLLQDSLGGDSKTLMLVQISPTEADSSETICSLNFASRVRGIELGPPKKQLESTELNKCKLMIDKNKQEMKMKDSQMKKMEDSVTLLELKTKECDSKNKSLQERVKELESQLFVAKRRVLSENAENSVRVDGMNGFKPLVLTPFSTDEKENNSMAAHPPPLPNRSGRASVCMMANRVQPMPSSRRKTMIITGVDDILSNPVAPFLAPGSSQEKVVVENRPRPLGHGGPRKKLGNGILRRSMQKKVQLKSPLPVANGRRVEKMIVGGRGRMAHRVLLGGRNQQNQIEKERGWNILS